MEEVCEVGLRAQRASTGADTHSLTALVTQCRQPHDATGAAGTTPDRPASRAAPCRHVCARPQVNPWPHLLQFPR